MLFTLTVGQVLIFQLAMVGLITTDEPITTTSLGDTLSAQDEQECICTPFNLCKTYVPMPDGGELIDIRINVGPCKSYLDICCNDTKTKPVDNNISTSTENIYTSSGCTCVDQEHITKQPIIEYTSVMPDNYHHNNNNNHNDKNNVTMNSYNQSYNNNNNNLNNNNKNNNTVFSNNNNNMIPSEYIDSNNHNNQNPNNNNNYNQNQMNNNNYNIIDNNNNNHNNKNNSTLNSNNHSNNNNSDIEYHVDNNSTTKPIENHSSLKDDHECGIWNKNGIGFKVVNAIDGESHYGEYPSMIAIFKKDMSTNGHKPLLYHCGGSLIKKNIVLTAAHCVINKDPSTLIVRAGEWDLKTEKEVYSHQDRLVSKIVTHRDYYAGGLYNDIALIFTEEAFYLQENIQLMCLPKKHDVYTNSFCFSSGWGKTVSYNNYTVVKKTESGTTHEIGQYEVCILKKVKLPIVSREKCTDALRVTRLGPKFALHDSFICAGGEEGKDTCRGDGGSPLMCPSREHPDYLVQVGIVAWGIHCGLADIPAVYVDVAGFRNWIDETIENHHIFH